MKKFIILLSISITLTGILIFPAFAEENNEPNLSSEQQEALEKLEQNSSNLHFNWKQGLEVPSFITAENIKLDIETDNLEEKAYFFLEEYKNFFKIKNPKEEFDLEKSEKDSLGHEHLKFKQKYQGVEVYAGEFSIHFNKNGSLKGLNGYYIPDLNISTEPSINKEAAGDIAKNKFRELIQISPEDDIDIQIKENKLYIYNPGLSKKQKSESKLAWYTEVYVPDKNLAYLFFIDAQNGEIIKEINGVIGAQNRLTYKYSDCFAAMPDLIYDEDGLVVGAVDDLEAYQAHVYVSDFYDYFYNFGRDSYDDNGAYLISFTNHQQENYLVLCENDHELTSWNFTEARAYFTGGDAVLDIIGHEFTHAIAINGQELGYVDQSAALNEGYADIFGEFLERENGGSDDWLIAEDTDQGTIRDIADPPNYPAECNGVFVDQPNYYSDYDECADDGEESHFNNGIFSQTAYYLTNGGTHPVSGITVNAIGQEKAQEIYYRALDIYSNVDSDFEDAYEGAMESCLDFYYAGEHNITTSDCESVYDAFNAVGIVQDVYIWANIDASETEVYAPATIDFSASDSFIIGDNFSSYYWEYGDGNIGSGENVSNTYTDVGDYEVSLAACGALGDCSDDDLFVYIDNPIEPEFTVSGDGVPAPATIDFDASATVDHTGNITDYSWNYGDNNSESTGTSPYTSHEYTADGYYNVVLTVTDDNGYTNTYSHSVFIGSTGPTYVSGTIYNDTWSAGASPYIITSSITIASGGTLNIEEGTVIKFQSSSGTITVNGTLNASGIEGNPVVFTSYQDDEYGGDANGDGNATLPEAGNWDYISFENSSIANIDNTIIRYGGDYDWDSHSMIEIYSDDITITNSEISDSEYNIIYMENVSPTLNGNNIFNAADGDSHGIYAYYGSPTIGTNEISNTDIGLNIYSYNDDAVNVTNNNFTNNEYPIYFHSRLNPGLTISGNTGSNNDYNAIKINAYTNGDYTLTADNDLDYLVDGHIYVYSGHTLTLEPGTVIKFYNSDDYIEVNGTLNALGTESDPIVFTSMYDDEYGGDINGDNGASLPEAGDWKYMQFQTGSTANLDHTIIRYGGYYVYPYYHMLEIYSDDVTITNSEISDSDYYNIYMQDVSPTISGNSIFNAASNQRGISVSGGSPTISENEIYDNSRGVSISNGIAPNIDGNTFSNNSDTALYVSYTDSPGFAISNNTFTDNSVPIHLNSSWTNDILGNTGSNNTTEAILINGSPNCDMTAYSYNDLNFPYQISDPFTISSGYSLTVEPGSVFKFYSSGEYLSVNGTLNALGTETDPIVFTSAYDDEYGGDINGDNGATLPEAGDWKYIQFQSGSTANVDHTIIRYGGNYSWDSYDMIEIYSDDVTITNSEISDSEYHNIYMEDVSPTLSGNTIFNSAANKKGISVYGGSPTINENEIHDNYYGIHVSSGTPTLIDNVLNENTYPIYIGSDMSPDFIMTGNTGSNNDYNAIYLSGVSTEGDITFNAENDFPYLIYQWLRVEAGDTLTINPGVTIKFYLGDYFTVYGTINALGTESDPIVFTSMYDDEYGGDINGDNGVTQPEAGNWRQINFAIGSAANLDHTIIRYGGYYVYPYYHMLEIYSDDVTITNSEISDSGYHNIYMEDASPTISGNSIFNAASSRHGVKVSGGSPTISENEIYDNSYGVYVSGSATPTITQNNIYDNSSYGIYASSSITAEDNWWGDTTGPYNANNNPNGLGDNVNDNVDFDPWLTIPYGESAPEDVTDLTATPGDNIIDLSWTASENIEGDLAGYKVYVDDGNGYDAGTDIGNVTSYQVTNLINGTTYTFRITAYDIHNVESTGTEVSSTPEDNDAPDDITWRPPRPFEKNHWNQRIKLKWIAPGDVDLDHYIIERFDGNNTITLESNYTGQGYMDTNLNYKIPYQYTIYAVDDDGNQSSGINSPVLVLKRPTPRNLTATAGDQQIELNWTVPPIPPIQIGGYYIYYGTDPNNLTSIDVGNVTNYTLTGLNNGTTYYIAASAYHNFTGQEGPRGPIVTAVPTP